jgi:hypothetical protein
MPLSKSTIVKLNEETQNNSYLEKDSGRKSSAEKLLIGLGVDVGTDFFEFFSKYSPTAMLKDIEGKELGNIDHIMNQISPNTFWAHELGLSSDFIIITNFEGEYFLAYSLSDKKVYLIELGNFDKANNKELSARWDTFEQLLQEYLS